MKNTLAYLVVIIATAAFFMLALSNANDSAARRAYAQAAIVREQSQARQDLLAAMLPYVALAVVVIVLTAVAGIVIYALTKQQPGMRIIETRTIIMLQPGQTRREFWQSLENTKLLTDRQTDSGRNSQKTAYIDL